MKRKLRHPINSIREPFGTAGLIVAMIALIAALGGTALAAAKLNSTQKKEVEKIAKKYAGKPGANGINGTNGSSGAAGKDGTNGAPGAPGESVKITESAAAIEGHCTGTGANGKGGSKFEVGASKAYACNGKEGSPWTAGGTLPAGKSETGTWALGPETVPNEGHTASEAWASVSFPIPLAAAIAESNTHIFSDTETPPTGCKLTAGFLETTESETLCIMVATEVGATLPVTKLTSFNLETVEVGAGRSGAGLHAQGLPKEITGFGTWTVTG